MKSITILKLIERALNPDLKDAHLKAYAKAMIEEDRQRVLTNTLIIDRDVIFESYNNTPIILD
jgi:hypothetical protein